MKPTRNRRITMFLFQFHTFSGIGSDSDLCFRAATSSFGSVKSKNLSNVSEVLESLIDGYDIRLRPKFGGMRALVI